MKTKNFWTTIPTEKECVMRGGTWVKSYSRNGKHIHAYCRTPIPVKGRMNLDSEGFEYYLNERGEIE